ncbi:hypothetical protein GCM10009109_03060 [Marinobacterium sediminicola]
MAYSKVCTWALAAFCVATPTLTADSILFRHAANILASEMIPPLPTTLNK